MPEDLSGYMRPADGAAEFNAVEFVVRNMLSRVSTMTLVKVVSSTNAGEEAPAGFVDILPLVNLIDGKGKAINHTTIYRCPVWRMQGGSSAVIIDPVPGDIGVAIFADRDISSVVKNKDVSNPGSFRRFSMADAVYLGGLLNEVATQFVRMAADGISITSPTKIKLEAPLIEFNAATSVTVNSPVFRVNGATQLNGPISQVPGSQSGGGAMTLDGPLNVTNDVTAAGKSVSTHRHSGGTIAGNTGVPL
jgi:hypothetical protein